MPREIGDIWLNFNLDRLAASLRAALPRWDQYPPGVQRALANMAYQLGTSGLLEFRHTLRLIDEGRYAEAGAEALDSRWAKQTPNRAREVAGWIANT
jgi:lysozyme